MQEQVDSCVASFLQLQSLLRQEIEPVAKAAYLDGKLSITRALVALYSLKTCSEKSWNVGDVCSVRRYDGALDLALLCEILEGVFPNSHECDDDTTAPLTSYRLCWLRPRSEHELLSTGFLVNAEQLRSSDLVVREKSLLQEASHVWVYDASIGYFTKHELMQVVDYATLELYTPSGEVKKLSTDDSLLLCPAMDTQQSPLIPPSEESSAVPETSQSSDALRGPPEKLAAWEQHTRGFGSKMLERMGYRKGEGLGAGGRGRLDPIEAHLGSVKGAGLSYSEGIRVSRQLTVAVEARASEGNETHVFSFLNKMEVSPPAEEAATRTLGGCSLFALQEAEGALLNRHARLKESLQRNLPDMRSGRPGDPRLVQQVQLKIAHTQAELDAIR